MTRRAIGPDQIKDGNKIECHVSGSCAGYLDTDGNWQISDNTVRQHFDSPDDSTTGREIWTNRPLTVGVNTYGARDEMVTIRESSSLGKHTEWTITPIDPYSLRRKSQPLDTEYDLGDQVVQATSNNTTRIFTPYTGQDSISYEITAPPGGEIREENGQFNAYRDDWYLFTIPAPTIYDAERKLITDDEGLPVRCYDLRVADLGRDEAGRRLYTVTKVRCCDAPAECAWVDVEIKTTSGNKGLFLQKNITPDLLRTYSPANGVYDATYGSVATFYAGRAIGRGFVPFIFSGVDLSSVIAAELSVYNSDANYIGDWVVQKSTLAYDATITVDDMLAFTGDIYGQGVNTAVGWSSITFNATGLADIKAATSGIMLCTRNAVYDYGGTTWGSAYPWRNGLSGSSYAETADYRPKLTLTVDSGHTGDVTGEIVKSVTSNTFGNIIKPIM